MLDSHRGIAALTEELGSRLQRADVKATVARVEAELAQDIDCLERRAAARKEP